MQKLWIKYDRSGRSLGEAFVVFSRREDCFEAIRQFDGKKAAGQEIYLTLMDEQGVVSSLRSRFSRSEQREGGRRANELRRDSRNKSKSHKKTPEELDAELEAYMSGTQPQELEQQQEAEPPAAVETTASRNDLANDDANKESSQVYHATDDMAMEA